MEQSKTSTCIHCHLTKQFNKKSIIEIWEPKLKTYNICENKPYLTEKPLDSGIVNATHQFSADHTITSNITLIKSQPLDSLNMKWLQIILMILTCLGYFKSFCVIEIWIIVTYQWRHIFIYLRYFKKNQMSVDYDFMIENWKYNKTFQYGIQGKWCCQIVTIGFHHCDWKATLSTGSKITVFHKI